MSGRNRSKTVATAAVCAALYAIANAMTSLISTPFGIGEFRPGVVIPVFFALVSGPIPAAIGAGVGSFIGDMFTLVPQGKSTVLWAIFGGGLGNFLGILALGWIYQKLKAWRGFIIGTTIGLFVGNLVAAAGVVFVGMYFLPTSAINPFPDMTGNLGLAGGFLVGLLLFWFGTMFPFVVILDPPLVRIMRPYASQLSTSGTYPEISKPSNKVLWAWSLVVAALLLAALVIALFSGVTGISDIVSGYGGTTDWAILFVISAIAVLAVGAFLPAARVKQQIPQSNVKKAS